jgi:hypothetical protein
MSMIGSVEMLVEADRADTSKGLGPTGAAASDESAHAVLNRATATSGMAAALAARKVPADTKRIETSEMGNRLTSFRGDRREAFPIRRRVENRQKMPTANAR